MLYCFLILFMDHAWLVGFGNGYVVNLVKFSGYSVRAVAAF